MKIDQKVFAIFTNYNGEHMSPVVTRIYLGSMQNLVKEPHTPQINPGLKKYVSALGFMEHLDTLYLPNSRVHEINGEYVPRTVVDTLKIGGKKFSIFSNYNGEDMKPVVMSLEEEDVQVPSKPMK
jgi:hypothetical protein